MRLLRILLIVYQTIDAEFTFYDLSRINRECRKTQLAKIFALDNPYEFGSPFRRVSKTCQAVTRYVSAYYLDNTTLPWLKINPEKEAPTADEIAEMIAKEMEKNQNI
ncbi:Oidioi.mRNA.OKI2018_I69.chr1.g498.t1.cds [Oikopleura dioica]|uniref:Oidioi.mRNA.OKI2018_I69.chr1.g498.t1.cds n=1 Tax=Oikopleura dioica TaxID=34765 RepID=A0ABN7SUA7_OIKDI|nr:Oidioi.mRNA.OKI2018_I69.chr1.g498.t1.cds [Oikopleura dioica]